MGVVAREQDKVVGGNDAFGDDGNVATTLENAFHDLVSHTAGFGGKAADIGVAAGAEMKLFYDGAGVGGVILNGGEAEVND